MFKCPRVGITLKKNDKYKSGFIMKPYRFYTNSDVIQKYKPLAIIHYINTNQIDISNIDEINKLKTLFNVTNKKIIEYKTMYYDAIKNNILLEKFIGKGLTKVGDLISVYAYCNFNELI